MRTADASLRRCRDRGLSVRLAYVQNHVKCWTRPGSGARGDTAVKLGLGTAQFGMNYGISNKNGQPGIEEASKILALAASRRIRVIDTAPTYGTSEEVLGTTLPFGHSFSLVTKTPVFNKSQITLADVHHLEDVFLRSLERMRLDRTSGLLIHRVEDLRSPGGHLLLDGMQGLKDRGLVQKLGVSVYHPSQLDFVLSRYKVDVVQLPLNVFDQRLVARGYLTKLKEVGIEIHARSVFLQGLLLMQPGALPPYFAKVRRHLERYHEYLHDQNLSPLRAALGFAAGIKEIDAIICGVTSLQEARTLCAETARSFDPVDLSEFAVNDISIIDPSTWRL